MFYDCAPDCPVKMLDMQSGETKSGVLIAQHPAHRGASSSRFFNRFEHEPPFYYTGKANERGAHVRHRNTHPTVKSIALMMHLVTPPGGLVLDPFSGSASTGVAALRLGMRFLGIEKDPVYAAIAHERLEHWQREPPPGRKLKGADRQSKLPGLD